MKWGKQNVFCCNCGKPMYTRRFGPSQPPTCTWECWTEYSRKKYTAMVMGKDAPQEEGHVPVD